MLFGGDEWWFFGPRIYPGDRMHSERSTFDYHVTNTSFAGPTMFQRGDTMYVNQRGEQVALQRSTAIRYLAENAQRLASLGGLGGADLDGRGPRPRRAGEAGTTT